MNWIMITTNGTYTLSFLTFIDIQYRLTRSLNYISLLFSIFRDKNMFMKLFSELYINHSYIILLFQDLETLDLDDYKHNHVNVTGFRLVDPSNQFVKEITEDMYIYQMNTRLPILSMSNYNTIPVNMSK
jgi:hypothetical protein